MCQIEILFILGKYGGEPGTMHRSAWPALSPHDDVPLRNKTSSLTPMNPAAPEELLRKGGMF